MILPPSPQSIDDEADRFPPPTGGPTDGPAAANATEAQPHASLIADISNFSIQYNLAIIAPALRILSRSAPLSSWAESIVKSAVFAGAITGQGTMGYLVDGRLGVRAAMSCTTAAAFVGAVMCVVAPALGDGGRAEVMMVCGRVVVGFGVGGKYPCGSAMKAETVDAQSDGNGGEDNVEDTAVERLNRSLAHTYVWQVRECGLSGDIPCLRSFGDRRQTRGHARRRRTHAGCGMCGAVCFRASPRGLLRGGRSRRPSWPRSAPVHASRGIRGSS